MGMGERLRPQAASQKGEKDAGPAFGLISVGVERGSAPVASEALTLPSAPSRAAVMPMRIVDPGFRPRLMLEAAEALELVRRAADAWATAEEAAAAAAAGPQSGATSATAADSAGMPLDDPSLVRLFQRHAVDGDTIHSATVTHVQRLWAGMGAVLEVRAETAGGRAGSQPVSALLIIKKVLLPRGALSFGDARKKVSYECESRFYEAMAGQLRVLGCSVPAGLLVDRSPETIVIVMSKMPGSPTLSGPEPHEGDVAEREAAQVREYGQVVFSEDSDEPDQNDASLSPGRTAAAVDFLAQLHGHTWGVARADRWVAAGLQPQGGSWYLDTRASEWEAMPTRINSWEGRLRRAARAIDRRLKDDPHQCIIHGDIKYYLV